MAGVKAAIDVFRELTGRPGSRGPHGRRRRLFIG